MRWRTDDDGGQAALFAEAERDVGRGEFRGMTFLHVNARRIVNSLPPGGRLPFRHTINAYRGCSHACSYCFARPTHAYLDLDLGEGFDRTIVVKVNAVARLRAELDPRRWSGEAIAMGTNTDPYQRAEGKYHLTRGLVEVLADAGNPFSLLTKSTLVVRDADLLAEASQRTSVSVNLSVGTLDEAVWRATEPGTPHPKLRLDAVARLRDAGIRCGVLVAPVLPGLSDGAEQLEAVVAGAVAAGASNVSGGMVVHLKPGTREVFLDRLAGTHPELVPRYESLFDGRSYAPRDVQRRVQQALADALDRHRPTPVPAPNRRTPTPALAGRKTTSVTAAGPPTGAQLTLQL